MSSPIATQVLSFENFGALENHLRMLKNRYSDMIKKYEETLGFILRDNKPTSAKVQRVQEQWALEMQRAITPATAAAKGKQQLAKKEEAKPPKMLGNGNGKDHDKDKPESTGEWVPLDPMSLFIGQKNRGLAEIYFDTINILRDNVAKITSALSICSALKAKAATAGSTSLVVAFVNDVPTKVMLKPVRDDGSKKYTMAFSFAVQSIPAAARTLVLK